jgi:hypothetical protein
MRLCDVGRVCTDVSKARIAFTLQQYMREKFEYNQSVNTRKQ